RTCSQLLDGRRPAASAGCGARRRRRTRAGPRRSGAPHHRRRRPARPPVAGAVAAAARRRRLGAAGPRRQADPLVARVRRRGPRLGAVPIIFAIALLLVGTIATTLAVPSASPTPAPVLPLATL